jgi:mycothiol synthase
VRVEEIDARQAPDDVLSRFQVIEAACWPEVAPGEPARTPAEVVAFLRHQPATIRTLHWIVGNEASASLHMHGPAATFTHILVHPAHRRRGLATKLLGVVRARCTELGVTRLFGEYATAAGAAFAVRLGAVDGQRVIRSLLDLRAIRLPDPVLPPGYSFLTWLRRVPDDQIASFARARAAMDDAPVPEGFEYPGESVERIRAIEDALSLRDRELRVTVAVDETGEIVAFSDLRVSRGSTLAFTDDTGTVASHRGRGLARAVKLESLQRVRADHPEVEIVTTMNAEENGAMRHINASIGFTPTVTLTQASIAP